MDVLNELYLGRGPVAPLRAQLGKLRAKLMGKPVSVSTNNDPEIIKFNRIAEKIFGFHTFSLYIQPDNLPNAYTWAVDTFYSEADKVRIIKCLTASPTGFKYNSAFPGVSIIVCVNVGLFDMENVTDDEIMATLLHEIGHGFFTAVTTPDTAYTASRKLSSILLSINKCAMSKIAHGKQIKSEDIDRDVNMFDSIINGIKKTISIFKKKGVVKEAMEDNLKRRHLQYTNEKFADTFAAMYGYGQECNSIDTKIMAYYSDLLGRKPKNRPRIIETIMMYNMYFNDLFEYIRGIQDEHPEQLARMKTTADYLKHEIAKETIDPAIKKELISELNKVNDLIEQYKNFPKDEDSMRILRLYQVKLYEKFGGDRREKDTDNKALFDWIDSKYDSLSHKNIKESSVEGEESIIEASNYSEMDVFLDILCSNADCYNESTISDMKSKIINIADLYKQWTKNADKFIESKWIYRYIDEKQKEILQEHYEVLKDPKVNYSTYKKSFNFICKFIGIPTDGVILDEIKFDKDRIDKDQMIISVRYSKGKIKINIPNGIHLIHAMPGEINGTSLNPSFRGKTAGMFMYPSNRVYFTCIKAINPRKGGMIGNKSVVNKYTPKDPITTAYIDPACPSFGANAVYVETDSPIPVIPYKSFLEKIKSSLSKEDS